MGRGRKSKYTPERVQIITKAIANGKSYKDAYTAAGVGRTVFYEWITENAEFAEAIKKAEQEYNEWYNSTIVQDAKRSLRELVLGFDYEEIKTESSTGKDGKTVVTKTTKTTKHVAPNPTAIIFALTNRDPDNWKNRQTTDINANVKAENTNKPDLSAIPDDLLEQVLNKINGAE